MDTTVFIVIETEDIEVVGVRSFTTEPPARAYFDAKVDANHIQIVVAEDVANECPGTMELAGDDAYAVQLIRTLAA